VEPPRRRSKPSADSFGTFLDAVQQGPRKEPVGGAATVVSTILATYGPQLVSELQVKSGMSFDKFAPLIASMREAGTVTVTGDPGREVVAPTPAGTR
jgi:hypothetical protein